MSKHCQTAHTHPFNGPFSGTTQVSQYQKGKTNLDFTKARDSEWQWHQLGRMQVCTSLQTYNHASNPPLSVYRPDALPAAQPTASKHWRQTAVVWKTQWDTGQCKSIKAPVESACNWLTVNLQNFHTDIHSATDKFPLKSSLLYLVKIWHKFNTTSNRINLKV